MSAHPTHKHEGREIAVRFIAVDDAGVPTTRDVPVYNLAGVLAEHQRSLRGDRRAA